MFYWNTLAFLMIQQTLAIWSLFLLPFVNPAWTSGSSQFTYCWSLVWIIFSITLLACDMSATVSSLNFLWHCPSSGLETDHFQSGSHCWVFQICWHIECSALTASSFRLWDSSTGIPSHLLALFVMMLLKVHLTLHYRTSGSRWVITPLWLSGSWRSFFV